MSGIGDEYRTIVLGGGQQLHECMPIMLAEDLASDGHMDCSCSFRPRAQEKLNTADGDFEAVNGPSTTKAPRMILHLDNSTLPTIASSINSIEHTSTAYDTLMPDSDKFAVTHAPNPQEYIMVPVVESPTEIKRLGCSDQSTASQTYLVQVPCEKRGTRWVELSGVCAEADTPEDNIVLIAGEGHDEMTFEGSAGEKLMVVEDSSLNPLDGFYLSEVASGEKCHHGGKDVRYHIAGSSSQHPVRLTSAVHAAQEEPPNTGGSETYHVVEVADSRVLSSPAEMHQIVRPSEYGRTPKGPVNLGISSRQHKGHHSSLDHELHPHQMFSTHLDGTEVLHEHSGISRDSSQAPYKFLGGTGIKKRLCLPSPIGSFKSPCSDGGSIVAGRVVHTDAVSQGSELSSSILDNSEPSRKRVHIGKVLEPFN